MNNCKKKNENEQKEDLVVYEALRNTIISCEEKERNVTIYMHVVYFAILTIKYSTGSDSNLPLFISFIIIAIFQSMLNTDRWAIERASTYIYVFFEEPRGTIHWEKLHTDPGFTPHRISDRDISWLFNRYGSSVLSTISLMLLIYSTIKKASNLDDLPSNSSQIVSLLLPLIFALFLWGIVISTNRKFRVNSGQRIEDNKTYKEIKDYYARCYPSPHYETPSVDVADTTPTP